MTSRRTFLLTAASAPVLRAAGERYAAPIDELRRKHRIPGLSAAIVRGGEVVWKEGFGYADIIARRPAMADTPYPIGWLTQAFSTTVALMLLEQGRLDLDEPVKQYIPIASRHFHYTREGAIKLRHLLTHTSSGVPPGETFLYDPVRFSALTHVLAQLCGKPFDAIVAERFFDAIPMPDSAPRRDDPEKRYQRALGELARPYAIDGQGRMVTAAMPDPALDASRGLVSTALDLAKFDIALDEHQFVREQELRLARTPAESITGKPLRCGVGWFAGYYRSFRVPWLFSDLRGSYSGLYVKAPEKHASMILLANTDGLTRHSPALAEGNLESNDFARWFLELL